MNATAVKAPRRKSSAILVTLSLLLGAVALLASLGGFLSVVEQTGYHKVTGEITSVDWKKNENAKPRTNMRCSPIVEYVVDGQTYSHGPDQYSVFGRGSECKYQSGDSIEVRYDPSDPSEATVSDTKFDWMMGIIGAAAAFWFGLCAPIMIILRSGKPRSSTEDSASRDYTQ